MQDEVEVKSGASLSLSSLSLLRFLLPSGSFDRLFLFGTEYNPNQV